MRCKWLAGYPARRSIRTGRKLQKGLHESYHPYPYLFIIIDEFAEMIADRAEFKHQLESITRVGRAQGVSLILAAKL